MGETARRVDVLVADGRPVFREGLRACLEKTDEIHVVGMTDDGAAIAGLLGGLRPDVLLIGERIRGLGPIETIGQVRSVGCPARILMLIATDDEHSVPGLWKLGVSGCVLSTASVEEIITAIQAVAQGHLVLIGADPVALLASHPVSLTGREGEVLRLLVAGLHNVEIARALNVTEKTVEFHVGHLYAKLGVNSRVEAVRQASRLGLLRLDRLDAE